MIPRNLLAHNRGIWARGRVLSNLLESRNLFNTQTVDYDMTAVCSMDLDPTGNFLLVGLSNGVIDLQGIQDPCVGTLDPIARISLSPSNSNRVQWNPGDEQFLSNLDNHTLYLVDPVELRAIDKFKFDMTTNWSEWNPNDVKLIAVCANESQVRLVDIRSGSSVQTIILEAKSGLASHRANRCLWSKHDLSCLIVGDNEGYLHVYDTRHSTRPQLLVGEESGQISGMAFTNDNNSILTSQGTSNHIIQWTFNKCTLVPKPAKFNKRPESVVDEQNCDTSKVQSPNGRRQSANGSCLPTSSNNRHHGLNVKALNPLSNKKRERRPMPMPIDAYIRCQFYVTDRHVFCPVSNQVKNSEELQVYDLESGERIKTLKSDGIMCQGVYSVTGLLPDALALYVGGRRRLRLWTLDEDHQRKMEEKVKRFHRTTWDSDDEL